MVTTKNVELLDGGMIAGHGDDGRLWDHVFLSPYALTRHDVIHADRLTGPNIRRDYAAHMGLSVEGMINMAQASAWYHEKHLNRGLAAGWLAEVDGQIVAVTPPPGHVPMTSTGPVASRIEMTGTPEEVALTARRALHHTTAQERAALRALHSYKRPAVTAGVRRRLADSIVQVGQVAPIIRWPGMKDGDEVIIDGQARLDICTELGITPWIIDIDRTTPATEVLVRLIEAQTQGKPPMPPERKRRYIDSLTAEFPDGYEELVERVGVSRSTIAASARRSFNEAFTDGERVWKGRQAEVLRALRDSGKVLRLEELTVATLGPEGLSKNIGAALNGLVNDGLVAREKLNNSYASYVVTAAGREVQPVQGASDSATPAVKPPRPRARRQRQVGPDTHVHTPQTTCIDCGEVLS